MIVRQTWSMYDDMVENRLCRIESDGYVCIDTNKTVRMKTPTVDLLCRNSILCAVGLDKTVVYGNTHPSMIEDEVYELTATRDSMTRSIVLSNPTRRLMKERSNTSEVIPRPSPVPTRTTTRPSSTTGSQPPSR